MKHLHRQSGVTLPEMGLYVGVLAILGVVVAANWGNVQSGIRTEQAFGEIVKVKAAAEAYRAAAAQGGLYTNITVEVLADSGYNVEPLDDGTDENAYGMDITIAAAGTPPDTDATLTYEFANEADCEQVVDRLDGTTGVKGTPTCTSATPSVLSVTIE